MLVQYVNLKSRLKTSSITLFTSSSYMAFFLLNVLTLPFEKCISTDRPLSTGGCHQHSMWLRHPSQNGEWPTETYISRFLDWDPHPTVSLCYETVWRVVHFCLRQVYLATWGHQVLHPGHNVPLSVCFPTPQSSKYSSWLPVSTLGCVALLMLQQCTGNWTPSPIISFGLTP